ncbi:site-2 protease family protein [Zavarzinella formosa]|uniref:site-2 protease family protein n=1 Tax=Zavarzinella formosa TaxID=360055 RepID=UPI0002EA6800|nr:site-2 protease family protein [Zavarzinella formosa]
MRDPFNWSIPLFRAFGIQVKLHILYIVITLGILGRTYYQDPSHIGEFALIWVVILFASILLHEFGHCFAARSVDGEADEILMWPLGGLAYCNVPHTVRANFITVAGGPLVNVLICLVSGAAIMAASYLPPVNIFQSRQLYYPELTNYRTGGSGLPGYEEPPYHLKKGTNEIVFALKIIKTPAGARYAVSDDNKLYEIEDPKFEAYPAWVLWLSRIFWVNLLLIAFNMALPAFPMDAGRMLQCYLWHRSDDYNRATQTACYVGMATAMLLTILAFVFNDSMLFALAVFIVFSCYQQLMILASGMEERGAFGYDFSKGYGGFGPDEDAPPKPKRVGPIKRWLLARKVRKEQRETEQRIADETRLDDLLDKISRMGKDSLTAEERRFMERVSTRYRNRP